QYGASTRDKHTGKAPENNGHGPSGQRVDSRTGYTPVQYNIDGFNYGFGASSLVTGKRPYFPFDGELFGQARKLGLVSRDGESKEPKAKISVPAKRPSPALEVETSVKRARFD